MLPIPASNQLAGNTIPVGGKYVLSGAYPFYNVYETRDGKFMTLGALEPKFWANFCMKVERQDLIARQFDSGEQRAKLFEEARSIFKSRTQSEWVEVMRDADCCCEPVLSMSEAFEHAQTRAREMVRKSTSLTDQLGFSYKLSDTPPRETSPAPELGQHTAKILESVGVSKEEQNRLSESGVIRVRR
jgi:alpha-methylacyl-CoA racemase